MALSIRAQALSLGLSCALGLAFGLLYDLLRTIRRHGGNAVWDALFCLCAASGAFLFAMRSPGGTLGTGDLLFSLLGLLVYFHILSPVLLPVFGIFDRVIGGYWINTQKCAKKIALNVKKLFQKLQD